MESSEYNIIATCQAGDLTAFGQLYDAYIRKIYNFIYFRTQHKETAEDIVSLVFLKALKNINGFDPKKGSFSSWLYRIARNTLVDYFRTHRPTVELDHVTESDASSDLAHELDLKQSVEKVQEYLKTLKPEQRELVLLRVWDGLSYQEIADILGKSEGSCRMMFSRTVAEMRKSIPLALVLLMTLRVWNNP